MVHLFLHVILKLSKQSVASLRGESEAVCSELNVNEHDPETWMLVALSDMLHVERFVVTEPKNK